MKPITATDIQRREAEYWANYKGVSTRGISAYLRRMMFTLFKANDNMGLSNVIMLSEVYES